MLYIFHFYYSALIVYVEDPDQYEWQGYMLAFSMIIVSVLKALIGQLHFYGKLVSGQRMRSALTAATYRKVLWLYFLYHCGGDGGGGFVSGSSIIVKI